jgi:hypothetical protein
MWKSLYETQAFQRPRYEGLEEYVFSCFERMYEKFEQDRQLIDPMRLHEVRYEDLIADPCGELGRLHEHLGLGDFSRVSPKIDAYLRDTKNYRANVFHLDSVTRSEIDRRWGRFMQAYGYCGGSAPRRAWLPVLEASGQR